MSLLENLGIDPKKSIIIVGETLARKERIKNLLKKEEILPQEKITPSVAAEKKPLETYLEKDPIEEIQTLVKKAVKNLQLDGKTGSIIKELLKSNDGGADLEKRIQGRYDRKMDSLTKDLENQQDEGQSAGSRALHGLKDAFKSL